MSSREATSDRRPSRSIRIEASWTAAAENSSLQPLAIPRVPVSAAGYRALCRFAGRWPLAAGKLAIEGASGLGAPLATRLSGDGVAVVDVPAKPSAQVRLLS